MTTACHRRVETRSEAGPNGWLVPIWNVTEDGWAPHQIYLTVVNPGATKGPHLHMKRCGRFTCIKGNVLIVVREESPSGPVYCRAWSGEAHGFATVFVPPGMPAAICNLGDEPAYVLNMPSPAWRPDDQDEHPVEGWSYKP